MSYRADITNPASLGIALQQARMASGMSQRQLAERLNTSQRYIWELESGKDSAVLIRILSVLRETQASMTIEIPEGEDG